MKFKNFKYKQQQKEASKEKLDTQAKIKELNEKVKQLEQNEIYLNRQIKSLTESKEDLEKTNFKSSETYKNELKLARENFERISEEFE